ncbi:hypothetical protein KUTeg_018838 [Tegillarca granosa]|uniref:Cholesterol side-chain cleavage enzyme, mitochondrial n=1 Tax=Tegillarca granosa TaxID=220873 RepID=A0ABQ9EFU5_TEGGR|nr:hypothetical protein KUTeg_018838 [Tegillarca granosa]
MAEGAVRSVVKKATSSVTKLNARPLLTEATATATTGISNAGFISNVKQQVVKPKALRELEGPTGYPILGTATEYFRKENRGKMHEVQRQFHQKYGKMFKERLGSVTNVSIADPKLVEDLLRKEGKYPLRPPYASWLLYKKLRKQKFGIMSSTGEEWLRNRQAMSQKLLRPKVIGEYVNVMNEVVGSLVDRVKYVRDNHSDGKTVPELPNELSKWGTESVAMVLLEERIGCLDKTVRPESQEFINSVGTMFLTGHQLMVFAESSNALGFMLYNLANSRRVQEKLQNQIEETIGSDWCTYDALQKLPYVKAIVKESLRLVSYSTFIQWEETRNISQIQMNLFLKDGCEMKLKTGVRLQRYPLDLALEVASVDE